MKIYVGNISYDTTENTLHKVFAEYGEVLSTRIMTDKFTGRTRGFGFVEMSSDTDGAKAIEGLHDTSVDNRNIIVNEARPQVDRAAGGNSDYNRRSNNRY